MEGNLFERMSVRVIPGVDPETHKLVRAEGLITEIKSSGICACEFRLNGRAITDFFYTETLVSIRGSAVGGWLERFEVVRPQIPAREEITQALFAAEQAYQADDRSAILQLARGLCSFEDACGAYQRVLRIRDALCAYATSRSQSSLSHASIVIEDYLTP